MENGAIHAQVIAPAASGGIIDKLKELVALKEAGALTEEEFVAAKTKALAEPPTKELVPVELVPVDANAPHADSFIPSEVRQLVEQLRGPIGLTGSAASELRNLNREYSNQVAFAEAGGIPPLVAMARDGTDEQKMWAAAVMESLTVTHSGTVNTANQAAIAKADGIAPLLAIVRGGKEGPTEKAASALGSLAHANVDNQAAVAKAGGIDALVALALGGTAEEKSMAAMVLKVLAWTTHSTDLWGHPATGVSNADNKAAIVKAGGIEALVALVRKGTESEKCDAAQTLGTLARDSAVSQVAIARAGGIDALVALYNSGNQLTHGWPMVCAEPALRALGCKPGFFGWTTPKSLREHRNAARAAAWSGVEAAVLLAVRVPEGVAPGQLLAVTTPSGGRVMVTVPEGHTAGMVFHAQSLPTPAVPMAACNATVRGK